MRTIWLTQNEVELLTNHLANNNDEITQNIRKELTIAKVRSSNNRVLRSVFINVLGKKDAMPYRFNNEEIQVIDSIMKRDEL